MLFSGKDNSIYMTREYFQEYSCAFDLKYYPFDTQVRYLRFLRECHLCLEIWKMFEFFRCVLWTLKSQEQLIGG